MDPLVSLHSAELRVLTRDRRNHSLAVGEKAASAAHLVESWLRKDLVTAATLHDVGYGHVETGFHPLDGARYLARRRFAPVVVNLVLMHSASRIEAEERGLSLAPYEEYCVDTDLRTAHSILWWADMTTGPQGQAVTVEQRLNEIVERYGPDDVVSRFIARARPALLAAGQSPTGSIQTLS